MHQLINDGYAVTVLTRGAAGLETKFPKARLLEVDYDSESSLVQALQGQEALVSTVAISAIANQERLIDAAITAGVKYYIPAEYTVNSREPTAQAQPLMGSIVPVQKYLATKDGKISWFVVNCGALMEYTLDHPLLLDFDNHAATLWDGGEGAISLSNFSVLAHAVSSVLRQLDRVVDHRIHVHGGTITQNAALEIAKKYSSNEWTTKEVNSQKAYSAAMKTPTSGAVVESGEFLANMITAYGAAAFGNCDGHFEAAYTKLDNGWLGVDVFTKNEIEEAIKQRINVGSYALQSGTAGQENLSDVAASFTKA